MTAPSVSVVIATYRRGAELRRAIGDALAQTYSPLELIVVDQTEEHDEATQRFVGSIDDPRFAYFLVTPASLPAARNFGLDRAKGDIVIFIDDDVTLPAGFVQAHVDAFDDDTIGAVAGRVREPGVPVSDRLFVLNGRGVPEGTYDYPYATDAYSAPGCNMSFRRDVIKGIGGFATVFIGAANHEEVDASERLRRAGYRIRYAPAAVLEHLAAAHGGCRINDPRGTVRSVVWHRNELLFLLRNRRRSRLPVALWSQLRWHAMNRTYVGDGSAWRRARTLLRGTVEGLRHRNDTDSVVLTER